MKRITRAEQWEALEIYMQKVTELEKEATSLTRDLENINTRRQWFLSQYKLKLEKLGKR